MASLNPTAEGLELLSDTEWIAVRPAPAGPGGTDDSELSWDAVTDAGELGRWDRARPSATAPMGCCSGPDSCRPPLRS